jgi:hypothetical protein
MQNCHCFEYKFTIYCSATEPKECLQTGKGVDYFGTESVTESGINCQRWDKQNPHQHNYWNLEDQENFCRNPDNSNRPWCFSMNGTVGREYCRIPYCGMYRSATVIFVYVHYYI